MNKSNTNFLHDTIKHKDMIFTFDGNSKITANNGTFENPKLNAFSLVQIQDCPGSTSTCRKLCYVHGLQKNAKNIHNSYKENSFNIKKILQSNEDTNQVINLFSNWISSNCIEFRWHVSGDIFSRDYAEFIKQVCFKTPSVKFWIYTKSFEYLEHIVNLDNLIVNISADKDNIDLAKRKAKLYDLRICYLSEEGEIPELSNDSVIFPNYNLRGRDLDTPTSHWWWQSLSKKNKDMICPVDFYGQSEDNRCGKCTKCMVN